MRLVGDQLTRLLVWSWDEQNLRGIADCFLAFGPDVEDNLAQICRGGGSHHGGGRGAVHPPPRGRTCYLEAWWHVPDGVPRVTPSSGRLDADLFDHPDEQVRIVRDLQDTIYAHTSPVIAALRAQTYAGFPVQVAGRAVATLSCLFRGDVPLRESQLELMRVLGRAAAVEEERRHAIEDRVLGLAQLEQAMERTVATLSTAVGSRDPYTVGARATGRRSVLGHRGRDRHGPGRPAPAAARGHRPRHRQDHLAGGDPEQAHQAERGRVRADPGPQPGRLGDAGARRPAGVRHRRRPAAPRALDGSGYPDGLSGDEIGEFARIVAVADVVEAMSSHRPYRPAIGVEAALQEIEEGRGVRYDERVTDACLRVFREHDFAFREEAAGTGA